MYNRFIHKIFSLAKLLLFPKEVVFNIGKDKRFVNFKNTKKLLVTFYQFFVRGISCIAFYRKINSLHFFRDEKYNCRLFSKKFTQKQILEFQLSVGLVQRFFHGPI